MSQNRIMVRPRRQAPPRVQHWKVWGSGWNLEIQCTEGGFFNACREIGIADPASKLESGQMRRQLTSTVS